MNWPLFGVSVYLLVVLRSALLPLVSPPGSAAYLPELLWLILVFVAMYARRLRVVLIVGMVVGLLLDVSRPVLGEGGHMPLIGPYGVGCISAGLLVWRLRRRLLPDSLVAFVLMTGLAGGVGHGLVWLLYLVRGLPRPIAEPVPHWHPGDALMAAGIEIVLTMAASVFIGWLLLKTRSMWGFADGVSERRFG